jgi:hypothetical protein
MTEICSEQQVRMRAYALWEAGGKTHGNDKEHWSKALESLRATPADVPEKIQQISSFGLLSLRNGNAVDCASMAFGAALTFAVVTAEAIQAWTALSTLSSNRVLAWSDDRPRW